MSEQQTASKNIDDGAVGTPAAEAEDQLNIASLVVDSETQAAPASSTSAAEGGEKEATAETATEGDAGEGGDPKPLQKAEAAMKNMGTSVASWWKQKAKPNISNFGKEMKSEFSDSGRKFRILKQRVNEQLGYTNKTVDLELQPQLELLMKRKQEYIRLSDIAKRMSLQLKSFAKSQNEFAAFLYDMAPNEIDAIAPAFGGLSTETAGFGAAFDGLVASLDKFSRSVHLIATDLNAKAVACKSNYDKTRLEYDSHRLRYEKLKAANSQNITAAEEKFLESYNRLEAVRDEMFQLLSTYDEARTAAMSSEINAFSESYASFFKGIAPAPATTEASADEE